MTGTAQQVIAYIQEQLSYPDVDKKQLFDCDKHREKRTKDANNYFWLLVNRLAEYQHISDTEVHDRILADNIHYILDENGELEWKVSEREPDEYGFIKEFHGHETEYYITLGDVYVKKVDGEAFRDKTGNEVEVKGSLYWHIKGTRQMNSKEMSRVISDIEQDAVSCGIPTKSDKEVERLLKEWEKKHG